jgi:hypothetical protein
LDKPRYELKAVGDPMIDFRQQDFGAFPGKS